MTDRLLPDTPAPPTAVVAMGGHAFMQAGERGTHEEHVRNAEHVCAALMALVERGYRLAITHGNGPQVGQLLKQTELTRDQVPPMPLDVLVAQTEGSLGSYLQRALLNEMHRRNIFRYVVTMVTQVLVQADDPAFEHPTKPIGPFLPREDAEHHRDAFGWNIAEDKARGGWRRVVPSPRPVKIIQADVIRQAVRDQNVVIAGGGGGIPVTIDTRGYLSGIEAVVDKDLTSSVLANDIGAELLVILTAVDSVYIDYGTDHARSLGAITMAECHRYMQGEHFPAGSMGPKVQAIYEFLQRGGRRGLITNAESLHDALEGVAGTHFIGRI